MANSVQHAKTTGDEHSLSRTSSTTSTPHQSKHNVLHSEAFKNVENAAPLANRKSPSGKRANPNWRANLLPYITSPESFSASIVVRSTEHAVLVRDAFPKAAVHLLLLPRSLAHTEMNPRDALSHSPAFLDLVSKEAAVAKRLAVAEIRRIIKPFSATLRAREEVSTEGEGAALADRTDLEAMIKVGVHAHPSMKHLHVHIISKDMYSDKMKHKKHYNSFTTDFFIPLEDFPLDGGDERWNSSVQNNNLNGEMRCWRCGKGFGMGFVRLKRHLKEEYNEWARV